MKAKFLLSLLAISLLNLPLPAQTTINGNGQMAQVQRGYTLGPGDEIDIKVLGEDQFSGKVTVDDNGYIEPPFTNKAVMAKCRTERELRDDVKIAFLRYMKNPQVSLQITKKVSRPPAIVNGAVKTPGQVELRRRVRLLELIAFSGDTTEEAGGTVQVWHPQPVMCPEPDDQTAANTAGTLLIQDSQTGLTNAVSAPVEIYKLADLKSGKNEANPWVRPGDVVYVPDAPPVYIMGQVREPKAIRLKGERLMLTQAIAMVGGIGDRAKTKDVKIYRRKLDSTTPDIISVNYAEIKANKQKDIQLQPYDIIEVDKAPRSAADILGGLAFGGIGSVVTGIATGGASRVLY